MSPRGTEVAENNGEIIAMHAFMSSFPGSPRLLKGGIALLDPQGGAVMRIIAWQYNPDTLSPTLQVKEVGRALTVRRHCG